MLLLPVRLPLYHLRKGALGGRRVHRMRQIPASLAARQAEPEREAAPFTTTIHAPFCEVKAGVARPDTLEELFAEARAQVGGHYRLAGGRRVKVSIRQPGRFEDSEDHHAYHRLQWAVRYSQAAAFGCPGAEEALRQDLGTWLSGNWEHDPVYKAPYTVAERIAALAECLVWSSGLPVARIKQQIREDANRLALTAEYSLGVHNHLLNDARGLYIASAALPECSEAARWREQAFRIWDEFFPKLVLEDGTFAEQSSHYHLLLCRTALEYWLAARAHQHELAAGLAERLKNMFRLANDLLRPDGTLPRFGDNSPDRTIKDLWGLMAAAWHYELLVKPPRHRAITPLTLYYCGTTPVCSSSTEIAGLRIYPNGGFALLRSADCEVIVHGDPRPEVAAHGDAGRGSFELWRNGEWLIRDPGSCWSTDPAQRLHRGGKAQNVTCLNGLAPGMIAEDRGYLPAWYAVQGGSWDRPAEGGIRFRTNGYQRIWPDIACTRTWRFEPSGELLFEETLEGSAKVDFETRLCLGDAKWERLSWDRGVGRGELAHRQGRMRIGATPHLRAHLQECTFLEEYGVQRNGTVLVIAGRIQLPISWRLRFSFEGNVC